MSRKPTKSSGRALREWRITLVRTKCQNLGLVEAPGAETAIKVAIEQFEAQQPAAAAPLVATQIGE